MTIERDDFLKIFDTIINNDGWWNIIKFERKGNKLNIYGKDQYGNRYTYTEEII